MIISIIQARTGSTRFPRKIYEDLNGKAAIQRVLRSVSDNKLVDYIILAMPEYDKAELYRLLENGFFKECTDKRFRTYFGDSDDLIARYYNAAKSVNAEGADLVVRTTADCPFGGVLIDEMLREYLRLGYSGYMANTESISRASYQDGVDCEIFPMWLLEEATLSAKTKHQREHVTPYFYDGSSKCNRFPYDNLAPHTTIPDKFYNFSFDDGEDRNLIIELCKNYDKYDSKLNGIQKLIKAIEDTDFPSREYKKKRSTVYRVVEGVLGYKRLDPIPDTKSVDDFYKNKYYEMIKEGTGKPEQLSRMLAEDKKAASAERAWLNKTTYSDIAHFIKKYSAGKKVLDIGCGTGDLVEVLEANGLDVSGLDPSTYAIEVAKAAGCKKVYNNSLEDFFKNNTEKFDAVVLVNVLEHVPDPNSIIKMAREMLIGGGIIVVIVPNDFSRIQSIAKKKIGATSDWWVAIPDHINYFNYSSLNNFMTRSGFRNVYTQGDFPMELFLLAGQNYIGNRNVGKKCHDIRVRVEMGIPSSIKRFIYRLCSKIGIGRDCFYVGKKV